MKKLVMALAFILVMAVTGCTSKGCFPGNCPPKTEDKPVSSETPKNGQYIEFDGEQVLVINKGDTPPASGTYVYVEDLNRCSTGTCSRSYNLK